MGNRDAAFLDGGQKFLEGILERLMRSRRGGVDKGKDPDGLFGGLNVQDQELCYRAVGALGAEAEGFRAIRGVFGVQSHGVPGNADFRDFGFVVLPNPQHPARNLIEPDQSDCDAAICGAIQNPVDCSRQAVFLRNRLVTGLNPGNIILVKSVQRLLSENQPGAENKEDAQTCDFLLSHVDPLDQKKSSLPTRKGNYFIKETRHRQEKNRSPRKKVEFGARQTQGFLVK